MNDVTKPQKPKMVGGFEVYTKGQGRQFQNDFLERFGRCHGLTPLFIYVPLMAYLFYYAAAEMALGAGAIIGLTLGGILFWSLTEYWLHRTLFHWKRFKGFHYFIHGIHHMYPNDLGRVVMPPGASGVFAVAFWFIFLGVLGKATAVPFFAGFVIGYLWYDMTHFWTHVAKPKTAWGKLLRKHHMVHHFSEPDMRFGVSTPFWDMVFGTYPKEQNAER